MNFAKSLKTSDYKEFVSIFNIENAKLLAAVLLAWTILFHLYFLFSYGNDRCDWLLKHGRPSGDSWQPYGCMTHVYSKDDARLCMNYVAYWGGHNSLMFVGDSRIRRLYQELLSYFDSAQTSPSDKVHTDLDYVDEKIALDLSFRWQPMVNESMYNCFKSWVAVEKHRRPSLIVVGSATWAIKETNASVAARANFRANLTTIMPLFEKLHPTTTVIWAMQEDVVELLLSLNRSAISNEQIALYNAAALDLLRYSSATIFSVNREIALAYAMAEGDGLHISTKAAYLDIQLLLNFYCNHHLNHPDASCCRPREPVIFSQYTVGGVYATAIIAAVVLAVLYRIRHSSRINNGLGQPILPPCAASNGTTTTISTSNTNNNSTWLSQLLLSFSRFSLVMSYLFLCDRTDFFMRENKQTGLVNFFLPLVYIFALGIFFSEKLTGRDASFMNRAQRDEWTGWMLLTILLYQFTGASNTLPVYLTVRIMISAFVFLGSLFQASYLLNGGPATFYHFCRLLFRLNFLVFFMCITMKRPFMFYYLIPLLTFWYLVVFLAFAIPPKPVFSSSFFANTQIGTPSSSSSGPQRQTILMSGQGGSISGGGTAVSGSTGDSGAATIMNALFRLLAILLLIVTLSISDSLFNQTFILAPLKFLFVSGTTEDEGAVREWRSLWLFDRYSAFSGAACAVAVAFFRQHGRLPDSDIATCRPCGAIFSVGVSLALLVGYTVWALICPDKASGDAIHAWIACPIILSYLVLRNIPVTLRCRYSALMAWFGRIWLELFLAQYHIWLAADTRGILVLVPNYPALNVIITSFIFICAAHELHEATRKLCDLLVPEQTHLLIRNFILFSLSLLLAANFHLFMPASYQGGTF